MGNEVKDDSSNPLEQAKGALGRLKIYASEVRTETKRVTWPGMQEVYGTTIMVILTTFLFGIYFALCDEAFRVTVTSLLDHLRHRG